MNRINNPILRQFEPHRFDAPERVKISEQPEMTRADVSQRKKTISLMHKGGSVLDRRTDAASNDVKLTELDQGQTVEEFDVNRADADLFENALVYVQKKEHEAMLAQDQGRAPSLQKERTLVKRSSTQEHEKLKPNFSARLQACCTDLSLSIKRLFGIKNTSSNVLTAKPLSGFYGAFAANAAGKLTTTSFSISGLPSAGAEIGLNSTGAVFSLIDGVLSIKDAIDLSGGINSALCCLSANREGAFNFHHHREQATAEDAMAFRTFMAAARKIPRLSSEADQALLRARLAAALDGGTATVASTIGLTKSVGAAVGTVAGTAAGALTVAGGVVSMVSGAIDVRRGFSEFQGARRMLNDTEKRSKRLQAWHDKGGCSNPAMRKAILRAFHVSQDRQHRQELRAGIFSSIRLGKGAVNAMIGSVLFSIATAALAGAVTVATAGLVAAVGAGVIATVFLASTCYKMYRRWQAEHTSKQRQRQAQALIATHSTAQLIAMSNNNESRQVVFESSGRLLSRTVKVVENEYLGLHLLARRLIELERLERGEEDLPAGAEMQTLDDAELAELQDLRDAFKAVGISKFDLDAIVMIARAKQGDDRLLYLKKQIAPALGLAFRTEADGLERALPEQVFLAAGKEIFVSHDVRGPAYAVKRTDRVHRDNFQAEAFTKVEAEFRQRIDVERFAQAVGQRLQQVRGARFDSEQTKVSLEETELQMMSDFVKWLARKDGNVELERKMRSWIKMPEDVVQMQAAAARMVPPAGPLLTA